MRIYTAPEEHPNAADRVYLERWTITRGAAPQCECWTGNGWSGNVNDARLYRAPVYAKLGTDQIRKRHSVDDTCPLHVSRLYTVNGSTKLHIE